MNNVLSALLALLLLATGSIMAGDAADTPVPLDFFDAARAPNPVPGQWIEYRVGFPVDPLESSLQPDPALTPGGGAPGTAVASSDGTEWVRPSFDPGVSWRVLPLRIKVREVTPEGCNAVLTFAGASHRVFLPAEEKEGRGELQYDTPVEGADRSIFVKMGSEEYEVEMIRRNGDGYGFVRYFCPEVPFGVFRFATDNVDLVMTGFGQGRPPEFPVPVETPIEPPVGQLYGRP